MVITARIRKVGYLTALLIFMRVVILYNSSWYVFLLRQNLIFSLQAAGHQVTVVAPLDKYTERVKQLGVDFIPINMSGTSLSPLAETRALTSVCRALRTAEPDVVLSFTIKCNLYAGLCRRLLKFRHVANISGLGQLFDGAGGVSLGVQMLYRIALARTQVVLFQNAEDRSRLTGSSAVKADLSRVIPGSGVDLSRFVPSQYTARSPRAFLMFGRLLPKKGFDDFMVAANELKRRRGNEVVFWILGAADHTRPESLKLLERIQEGHARGAVRYLQSTDDPVPFIREADVVVLPSTYNEGVPRSLLEALACAKPVVTTDWKGCRETVEHGKNGFLVRPHDTNSLIEALDHLVQCKDKELERFGRQSRAIAEQRFDERLVLQAYHEAIRDGHCLRTSPKDLYGPEFDRTGSMAP